MERERFVRENPEKAIEQDREGWKGIYRIIGIVTLGASTYMGLHKYCDDDQFSAQVNQAIEKAWQGYISLLTDIESPRVASSK